MSRRKGSSYKSGRSRYWIKSKNPDSIAVKRESEEGLDRSTLRKDAGFPPIFCFEAPKAPGFW